MLALVIISFNSSYFLLIGHECPYDIIMTNIQNNLSKSNSKVSTAFPPLPGLFMENQSWDTGGQFILKPRDSAGSQQQSESSTFLHYHRTSHFNFAWNINAGCHFFHGRGTVENIPKTKQYVLGPVWHFYILISRLWGKHFICSKEIVKISWYAKAQYGHKCVHTCFVPLEHDFMCFMTKAEKYLKSAFKLLNDKRHRKVTCTELKIICFQLEYK